MRDEVNAALSSLIERELALGAGEVAAEAGRMLNAGGKRLRPLLFLLAYRLAGGTKQDDVMPLALAFELIHTATLVHDDINDEACLLYTSPSPRDKRQSRMPSSA